MDDDANRTRRLRSISPPRYRSNERTTNEVVNEPAPNDDDAIRNERIRRDAIREERMRRRRALYRSRYRRPNETTHELRNDDILSNHGNDDESVSLTLGLTSHSPLVTPPPLRAPPPPVFLRPTTALPTQADPFLLYSLTPPYESSSAWLNISLQHSGLFSAPNQPPPPLVNNFSLTPPSNQTTPAAMGPVSTAASSSRLRSVRNRTSEVIPPPFPWATNIRGKIHTLENLESRQIATITGEVQCRGCKKSYTVSYNLREKFAEVKMIFQNGKSRMRERAPTAWTDPELPSCERCGHQKAVKPVIALRKRNINWLFLLLGQTLGHCTLGQLKNFCKHAKSHRTGAKDRVLYLTYLGLCKMLEPDNGLFDL